MAFRPERPTAAYRIADSRHLIFDGTGAYLLGGRWNSPGRRVIYTADSFAAAMLEVLVHASIGRLPKSHQWIEITIPAGVSVEAVDPRAVRDWNSEESEAAKEYGDRWYDSRASLVLLAPSVVTRGLSSNIVINQEHPEFAKLRASAPASVEWDRRLFGAGSEASFQASR